MNVHTASEITLAMYWSLYNIACIEIPVQSFTLYGIPYQKNTKINIK